MGMHGASRLQMRPSPSNNKETTVLQLCRELFSKQGCKMSTVIRCYLALCKPVEQRQAQVAEPYESVYNGFTDSYQSLDQSVLGVRSEWVHPVASGQRQ